MRVSLINPPFPVGQSPHSQEPLGLLYLGAMIKKEHDIQIIDAYSNRFVIEEIINIVRIFNPNVVGISFPFAPSYNNGLTIAQKIKQLNSEIIIVAGGNLAKFEFEKIINNDNIDFVVIGEGEISFQELIDALEKPDKLDNILGIIWKEKGEIKINPKRPQIENLDILPFPAREFWVIEDPENLATIQRSINTARGCPHRCFYCSTTAFWGSKYRFRSPENVISEIILLLQKYNIHQFAFTDDNFLANKDHAQKLCKLIVNKGLKVSWGCSTRLETIDEETLSLMRESGCTRIFFGVESGNSEVLEKLNRKYTSSDVIRIVEMCKSYGIIPICSFIIGFPFDTKETINDTLHLMQKLPCFVQSGILTPFPGTDLYNNPSKYGVTIQPISSYEDFDLARRSLIATSYLTVEDIENFALKAIGISSRSNWGRIRKSKARQ